MTRNNVLQVHRQWLMMISLPSACVALEFLGLNYHFDLLDVDIREKRDSPFILYTVLG